MVLSFLFKKERQRYLDEISLLKENVVELEKKVLEKTEKHFSEIRDKKEVEALDILIDRLAENQTIDALPFIRIIALKNKRVWNISDLMLYSGWSKKTIYSYTSKNKIPYSKPTDGTLFFDSSKLINFLVYRKYFISPYYESLHRLRIEGLIKT